MRVPRNNEAGGAVGVRDRGPLYGERRPGCRRCAAEQRQDGEDQPGKEVPRLVRC
ncbi:hypothetical protein ACIRD6_26730 [Streptomyces sp. NPDC102473]|uniref:hypothetical protein n=1 Tax=Streptomyces sp. NPDC102473 TaxID=3366180 RepID=UPI0038192CE1